MNNKTVFILYTISSVLYAITGISILINKGFSDWSGVTNIALSITFGSLAVVYYKRKNRG